MKLHDLFTGQTRLASNYLDDGAPFSAARVLRDLAADLEQAGRDRNAAFGIPMPQEETE